MSAYTFLGFLLSFTLTAALMAENITAQSVKEVKISINLERATIPQTFEEIESKTEFRFLYNRSAVESIGKQLNLHHESSSVEEILIDVSGQSGITFHQKGKTIVVSLPEERSIPRMEIVQETVSGQVTDQQTGEPLPGVNVVVMNSEEATGSVIGTQTDSEGEYTIDVPESLNTLVFSYVGYQTEEIEINGRTEIMVELQQETVTGEELVVIGYGTQQKINLTGAVSTVSTDDIENRPIRSVGSGLQGLMPGVTVRNSTALPGQGWGQIRIRGISTWGDAAPLVVIDGIPGGNLHTLNPGDIEDISVLKDAAAASIYGVRGSNGVIVVTTKEGSEQATPSISYSNYFGFQTPTALPEFTSSVEYMNLLNEALVNTGQSPRFTQEDIEIARNGSDPNFFANTDWVDEIYKSNARQQNHNIGVGGGRDDLNYYFSYGFLKEGGLLTGDNFSANRNNVRLRLNTTLRDRLQIDANLGYIDRDHSGSTVGISASGGPLYRVHQISPLVPVRFTNGSWGTTPEGSLSNPIAWASDGGTNTFKTQEFTGNIEASLQLTEGFSLRAQYGQIRSNSKRDIFLKTIDYYHPETGNLMYSSGSPNRAESRDYTSFYQTMIGMLEYENLLAEKHEIKAMMGASQEETIGEIFTASRENLPAQNVGSLNLGSENIQNNASATQNALQSIFGRLNYVFNDKYLTEFNFRYDGSSRFHPDVRWNWFTSASVGWIFSEENFFSGLRDVVETGKIRLSYGSLGNDSIGSDFPYMFILDDVETMPIGNQVTQGFRHNVAANRLLTWESAIKQNAGLDLTMLNGRLGVTGEYFINETRDILLNPPLPAVYGYGFTDPPQNAGTIENKGWEIQLAWRDQVNDFSYGINFNLSDVRNQVTDLGGVDSALGDRVRIVGHPLDAFYGLVSEGIAQVEDFTYDEETDIYTPNFPVIEGDPVAPGDLKYRDLNGDGEITLEDDRRVIGSHIPRYTYGFRGDLGWKGIDFSFFIQGVGKADGYIQGAGRHAFVSVSAPVPQEIHLDRWTPENTDASYPRLTYLQDHNTRLSTFWLEDASYLRLKNIQLGYTLPSSFSGQAGINRARIYASADNLFTKTDFFYSHDPESPVSSGGYYPQVKTLVFGLELEF